MKLAGVFINFMTFETQSFDFILVVQIMSVDDPKVEKFKCAFKPLHLKDKLIIYEVYEMWYFSLLEKTRLEINNKVVSYIFYKKKSATNAFKSIILCLA